MSFQRAFFLPGIGALSKEETVASLFHTGWVNKSERLYLS